MDPTTTLTNLAVGGAVGACMKLLMAFGATGRLGTIIALLLNAFIVVLFAYTHENHYERMMLWTYFVMFLDSSVASFAGYHVTNSAVQAAVNARLE